MAVSTIENHSWRLVQSQANPNVAVQLPSEYIEVYLQATTSKADQNWFRTMTMPRNAIPNKASVSYYSGDQNAIFGVRFANRSTVTLSMFQDNGTDILSQTSMDVYIR